VIGVQCAGTGDSGSHDSGFLDRGRWQIAVGYRKQLSHRHYVGTEEQKIREQQGTEIVNDIHLFDVALTYAVSRRFNLTVGVPIQIAKRTRPGQLDRLRGIPNAPDQVFHSAGIGDVTIVARWWLLKPPSESGQNISFGIGLKFPTGKPDVTDTVMTPNGLVTSVVDQSIQLGDGGWGIPLDLQAYKRIKKTTLYASATYLLNPRDTNGVMTGRSRPSEAIMSVSDQYLARIGFSHPVPHTRRYAFTMGWRIEGVPVRDLIGKSNGFRRPGYAMSVEPGLQYFRRRDTWSLSVPVAVRRNRKRSVSDILVGGAGDAAFADYLITLGYSHRF
jgi:hypothetical protein